MKRLLPIAALLLLTTHAFAIQDELNAAVEIDAVQPSTELVERIERTVREGDEGAHTLIELGLSAKSFEDYQPIISDGMPYYLYSSQKNERDRIIHPMRLGRFLKEHADHEFGPKALEAALSISHTLPSGALSWYYPRHYNVNRMLGERLKFSAISQGTMVSALIEIEKHNEKARKDELAKKAMQAMLWPFEKGGVNLSGKAVLEMPSFAGPPENILNGWIDALLHIRDYAELYDDKEALSLFRNNIEFLVGILPNFDDKEAGLSRYSDMSPYRAKLMLANSEDIQSLQVLYRPLVEGIPAIRVPLELPKNPDDVSVYDNQIIRVNGKNALVWLSCSQLYETVVVAKSDALSAEIDRGTFERQQSTPGYGGEILSIESNPEDGLRLLSFGKNDGLICGYPTNFSHKQNTNPYHIYHVVGLLYLALGSEVSDQQKLTLIEWAEKWLADAKRIENEEGLTFRAPDDWIKIIEASKIKPTGASFDEMLSEARSYVSTQATLAKVPKECQDAAQETLQAQSPNDPSFWAYWECGQEN